MYTFEVKLDALTHILDSFIQIKILPPCRFSEQFTYNSSNTSVLHALAILNALFDQPYDRGRERFYHPMIQNFFYDKTLIKCCVCFFGYIRQHPHLYARGNPHWQSFLTMPVIDSTNYFLGLHFFLKSYSGEFALELQQAYWLNTHPIRQFLYTLQCCAARSWGMTVRDNERSYSAVTSSFMGELPKAKL